MSSASPGAHQAIRAVTTITPQRLSFAGGGSDIAAFYAEHGGAVVSSAINSYVYVTVKLHSPLFNEAYRLSYSKTEHVNRLDEMENDIARECLRLVHVEPPLYIARRVVRMAIEDIGLADPEAVHQALAAKDAFDFLGSPEGELALAQAVIYMATAPKSNAVYTAFGAARRSAKEHGSLTPPAHILNAPTKLMKDIGYGAGYEYDHAAQDAFSGQNYFPDSMRRESYYQPTERGFEKEIAKRLAYWAKLRAAK